MELKKQGKCLAVESGFHLKITGLHGHEIEDEDDQHRAIAGIGKLRFTRTS
jgi:hypothetical protein